MDHPSNAHHLVLGELKDILSGQMLPDTHDERYRQKIAGLLLDSCGFDKKNLQPRFAHLLKAGRQTGRIMIDFLIRHKDRVVCLIKYAPGSLVTRRLSTIALSRTVEPYQIPFAVVTNGEDAEILDGKTGKLLNHGLECLPTLTTVDAEFSGFSFKPISSRVHDQASRIAFACEVDGACPCDTDVCIIESTGLSKP